MLVMMKLC
jgi:hypothetical protein